MRARVAVTSSTWTSRTRQKYRWGLYCTNNIGTGPMSPGASVVLYRVRILLKKNKYASAKGYNARYSNARTNPTT